MLKALTAGEGNLWNEYVYFIQYLSRTKNKQTNKKNGRTNYCLFKSSPGKQASLPK